MNLTVITYMQYWAQFFSNFTRLAATKFSGLREKNLARPLNFPLKIRVLNLAR
jgi:hypothetical protein